MPDGSQHTFGFRPLPASRLRPGEIVVDLFAGGGGASVALEQALQRPVDIAINHDADAVGMHAANHPLTRHHTVDVWEADPRTECGRHPVGWLHASPDCTHFSQAKGGQPRSRATRSLSWVVIRWAGTVRPRIISLENVRQILQWGPLVAKRDKATGRVITLDMIPCPDTGRMIHRIAAPGERVPIERQWLVPDKRHAGRTWRRFIALLRGMGYAVEWDRLTASDYGAGTSRERLFLIARRDCAPIHWPAPTHGPARQHPHVTAADSIDWSIPCPSIFDRKKPLADATLRRIARGVQRHVIDAAEPFFITEFANASRAATWSAEEPLRTQCAGVKGGHFAVVAPVLLQASHGEGRPDGVKRWGTGSRDMRQPMPTLTASGSGGQAVVAAFLAQANGGGPNGNPAPARSCRQPLSSITATGSQQQLVTCTLSPEAEAGALRVAALLINYYGNGTALDPRDPLPTITTRDRLALVTVMVQGTPHVIVDIALRMLRPHELYRAQGFPPGYIHHRTANGRPLTITAQVRMVGNSVSPPPLYALARANLETIPTAAAAAA